MSDQLHKPGDWMKVFRRIRFTGTRDGVRGATIKAVGTMLASYANYKTGDEIHPGTARLAVDCEVDYRTAKRCVAILRDLGLIVLVKRAERRGLADEYRLDLPEDLLDREEIGVLNPDEYEAEIDQVRGKHRGKYVPRDSKDDSLRGTPGTAELGRSETVPEKSAGHAGHRRIGSAGHAVPNLRGTPCPPTYQSTYQGLDLPSQSGDLSGPVTVPEDPQFEDRNISPPIDLVTRPRCPHGRTTRRDNGTPRCVDCRTQAPRIEVEAVTARLGPSKCAEHKLPIAKCNFCRRGLPGAEA